MRTRPFLLALSSLALAGGLTAAEPSAAADRGRGAVAPMCVVSYGEIVCGYGCATGYGEARCASTPEGACVAQQGAVTCFEPSTRPRRQLVARLPRAVAGCRSDYGETTCGYACVAGYGSVACARTPFGVCQAAYGQLVCWDPPWVTAADVRAVDRDDDGDAEREPRRYDRDDDEAYDRDGYERERASERAPRRHRHRDRRGCD